MNLQDTLTCLCETKPCPHSKKRKALDEPEDLSEDDASVHDDDSDDPYLDIVASFERRMETFFQIEAPKILETYTAEYYQKLASLHSKTQRDLSEFPGFVPASKVRANGQPRRLL